MRDPKEIIRSSLAYASEQRPRSWWHFVSTLTVLAALVAAICIADSWVIRLPVALVLGLVLVRVFIIYHDVQHGTILKGSRIARALMCVYGLLVLNPPRIWSRSHDHHHRIVGRVYGSSIGSYPVMTRAMWDEASTMARLGYVMQ